MFICTLINMANQPAQAVPGLRVGKYVKINVFYRDKKHAPSILQKIDSISQAEGWQAPMKCF